MHGKYHSVRVRSAWCSLPAHFHSVLVLCYHMVSIHETKDGMSIPNAMTTSYY